MISDEYYEMCVRLALTNGCWLPANPEELLFGLVMVAGGEIVAFSIMPNPGDQLIYFTGRKCSTSGLLDINLWLGRNPPPLIDEKKFSHENSVVGRRVEQVRRLELAPNIWYIPSIIDLNTVVRIRTKSTLPVKDGIGPEALPDNRVIHLTVLSTTVRARGAHIELFGQTFEHVNPDTLVWLENWTTMLGCSCELPTKARVIEYEF